MVKQYNPFQMLGSYLGAVGLLLVDFFDKSNELITGTMNLSAPEFFSFELAFSIMIGFIIGWGIHSLIRRFKK